MVAKPIHVLACGLLLSAAFAGCLGPADVEPGIVVEEPEEDPAWSGVGSNATGGLGAVETNQTTGQAHIHDYWEGRNRVDLVDNVRVDPFVFPVFPNGRPDPNDGVWYVYYQFPHNTLVYEGTGRMEVVVSELDPVVTGLKMRYLTPEASEFTADLPLTPDAPFELAITPRMTDMPHSVTSGWAFEFYADGSSRAMLGGFTLSITIYKANEVEKWPGHPDFYPNNLSHRVVMEQDARTDMTGVVESWFFNEEGNWNRPERLISMGTQRLTVFVNVTGASSLPGIEPTGYFLEYKNASMGKVAFGKRVGPSSNSTSDTSLSFDVWVDPASHDAPYAEQSRWAFRLMATFANAAGIGLCPGCFPYSIDYHITVIAYPFESEEARLASEGM